MSIMSDTTVGCWDRMAEHLFPAHAHFQSMVAAALKEAVEAEQDRCAKIAEYFWKEKNDPLLPKSDPHTAYYISTNIRALRRPISRTT